jgi:TetR/AcrR family acrAB operon transcriptional repressor
MARKTKEEAAVTRESILMAALDLFTEKGYSSTTLVDIAKRIGMTRGAVYWHFENKQALLTALIGHICERKENRVYSEIPEIHSVNDLRYAYVTHARLVVDDPIFRKFEFFMGFQMEWSAELLTETDKELNQIRKSPMEEFRSYFEVPEIKNRLRAETNVDQLALTLVSCWVGACKLYMGNIYGVEFGHDPGSGQGVLAETVGRGFDFVMNGVLKEESGNE